jgi:hypothetical protein
MKPEPAAIAEAKRTPNGWVYVIEGDYRPNKEFVPRQAIKGAWKVDAKGEITGEFIPNPNYVPNFPRPRGDDFSEKK